MQPQSFKRSYPWAANPLKLGEAIRDLERNLALDRSTVITEETIAARYVVRKGAFVNGIVPTFPKPVEKTAHVATPQPTHHEEAKVETEKIIKKIKKEGVE